MYVYITWWKLTHVQMEYNRQDWREVVIHVKGMMMWMMET